MDRMVHFLHPDHFTLDPLQKTLPDSRKLSKLALILDSDAHA